MNCNDGYEVINTFQEWDRKQPKGSVGVFPDPLYIGHFMNWLELTPEGREYAEHVVAEHTRRRVRE